MRVKNLLGVQLTAGQVSATKMAATTASVTSVDVAPGGGNVILTVIWCGTAGVLNPPTTQIGVFASLVSGADVHAPRDVEAMVPLSAGTQLVMAFDGCGATYGTRGTLFAHGLKGEVKRVVAVLAKLRSTGHHVTLNVLGLSRGGCAVYLLMKALPRDDDVTVNTCVFDPVPGNLITSSTFFDCCRLTVANQVTHLSAVKCNWVRCLAIYPYIKLPDIAFHAPVLPDYPPGVQVEEDSALGCHQGALWPLYVGADTGASFVRLYRFLHNAGTAFNGMMVLKYLQSQGPLDWAIRAGHSHAVMESVEDLEQAVLKAYDSEVAEPTATDATRHAHATRAARVLRNSQSGKFLNMHHIELAKRFGASTLSAGGDRSVVLSVQRKGPPLAWARTPCVCLVLIALVVVLSVVLGSS